MRTRNMDQMAQHVLQSIMSPKWGHLIIIGTMWLTIITLYSKLWWNFKKDSKYFVLCLDNLSNILYFI